MMSVSPQSVPFSTGICSPMVALPSLACDCHMHVFNSGFPAVRDAPVKAPDASMGDYRLLSKRLGIHRSIIVQPSMYGTDNRLLLRSLSEGGDNVRGIAVVNDQISNDELQCLSESGVVGVRFNQVQKGATELPMLTALEPHLIRLGWHVQMHLTPEQLLGNVEPIANANFPIVLDHFARLCSQADTSAHVRKAVFKLMRSGNVWLKLTAPYLASVSGAPDFLDLLGITMQLVQEFPNRLLWGTDWPHATEKEKPDDAKLIDWLDQTIRSTEIRKMIFAENSNYLYRFS
jgi:D-galactarolactone isomerase